MSTELRDQITKLLSDIAGEMPGEDEEKIISNAYKKLSSSKKRINEETIIDAVLASFNDDYEEDLYFENPYEDDLLDLLRVSSYDDNTIKKAINSFAKEAANEKDMHNGAKGSYYDEKGKDYRPKNEKAKLEDEYEIKDEGHKDIEYHNEATKIEQIHRSRADMLNRSL